MAGKLPTSLYTDFDSKLLSSSVLTFCAQHNTMVIAAPSEQQNQNGLVERTWQTLSHMARAFVTDKHMPRSYWFWAIRHAARVHNIFPIKFENKITTHHELVYGSKPDYRQLFRLFSTAYFSHTKDGTKTRTNVQSHSMQGIAVGWSDTANGMEIYNPITKQLYTTTVYKLDEHNQTKLHFNLTYDGGIYSGLLSLDSTQNLPEPYPIGTAVSVPGADKPSPGYVISVPSFAPNTSDPPYTIQLVSGGTTSIPLSIMDTITSEPSNTSALRLPSWIQHDAKVRFTQSRVTHQGRLHLTNNHTWSFVKKNKLGAITFQQDLPNFQFMY